MRVGWWVDVMRLNGNELDDVTCCHVSLLGFLMFFAVELLRSGSFRP